MNAAIAQKLNVLESAIVRIEEWANVLFVVVKGLGARFVSKKVVKVEKKIVKSASWTQGGYEAVAKLENGQYVVTVSNGRTFNYSSEKFMTDMDPEVMAAGGCTNIQFNY